MMLIDSLLDRLFELDRRGAIRVGLRPFVLEIQDLDLRKIGEPIVLCRLLEVEGQVAVRQNGR